MFTLNELHALRSARRVVEYAREALASNRPDRIEEADTMLELALMDLPTYDRISDIQVLHVLTPPLFDLRPVAEILEEYDDAGVKKQPAEEEG